MAKQNIRQVGGGGGRAVGKGKPGYPVPQAMLPDDDAIFEDLVAHVVLDITPKVEPVEFVDAADPVDLVVRSVLAGVLGEAESPEKLHKGIEHLDELKPAAFMAFLEKYKDLPLKGGLEVSEKVDGSARISFGVDNGAVWTQSKNGPKRTSPEQYGDKPMFRAIRKAHEALQASSKQISASWPKGVGFMVAEVLYTKIPNSIEYGPNVVMVHGVHGADGSVLNDSDAKKVVDIMTKALGGKLHDGKEEWLFEYKRVINAKDVMVDVKNEYKSIRQIYDELKKLEPDKLKAIGKAPYKASLEKFKAVQVALKKKLLVQLHKQRSVYGPEGGDVEGIVFRDLESGALTKLVDKEYFSKLNKFLWHYRELLDKGVKVGDKWEVGIMQNLRNGIADKVFGLPVAKTPGFVQQLAKFGNSLGLPDDEKRVDTLLAKYVEANDLMKGDFMGMIKKELSAAWKSFKTLMSDWEKKKKTELVYTVNDEDGKPVKKVKMDRLIKDRTDEAFESMSETLSGIGSALENIYAMKDDTTRKVALMKVFLGGGRLEKLEAQLSGGGTTEESVIREDLENPAMYRGIVKRHAAELAKRNIHVGKEIGSGANGVVFDIGGGKVLKVTIDEDEALASNHVKGKNLKHVVHVNDVFKFKTHPNNEGDFFGIVQEKLTPLSQKEIDEIFEAMGDMDKMAGVGWVGSVWRQELKKAAASVADKEKFRETYETLNGHGIFAVLDELAANDVDWFDLSPENLMKKDGKNVAIDLGVSDSPGKMPQTIEQTVVEGLSNLIREAKADKIGVTIGRFQPFHKGHAEMIRDLARRFNKVIVIVAGNSKDKKNPFTYETRLEMMKKSLPDVMSKVEVYKAQFGGKGSGYIPGIMSDIIKDTRSSVEGDTAITILVGEDRFEDIQKQLESARQLIAKGTELMFNPDLAVVEKLKDVKNDDEADRVSGTRVREAISADDKEGMKKLLDPHITGNSSDFEEIYVKLRSEYAASQPAKKTAAKKVGEVVEKTITELLTDVGGAEGIKKIVDANADKLLASRWKIDVKTMKQLGSGLEGVAYDVGNGRVLKVTTDRKEALTSMGIKGKTNLKRVVKIFDVFSFKDTPGTTEHVYGIVTEHLTPLSSAEEKELDSAIDELQAQMGKKEYLDAIWTGDFNILLSTMKNVFEADIAKESGGKLLSPRAQNVLALRINKYKTVFEKYKINEMMKELKSLRIKFADYHAGNVMKRGSEYVINDLGRSETPSKTQPPQLESVSEVVSSFLITTLAESGFAGPGNTAVGMKAGSSAWSAAKNRVDPNSKELWQNSLIDLQLPGTGSIDANIIGDDVV